MDVVEELADLYAPSLLLPPPFHPPRYCFSLIDVVEDFAGALDHKNPKARLETAVLLRTLVARESKAAMPKLTPTLLPAVAKAAAEAVPEVGGGWGEGGGGLVGGGGAHTAARRRKGYGRGSAAGAWWIGGLGELKGSGEGGGGVIKTNWQVCVIVGARRGHGGGHSFP